MEILNLGIFVLDKLGISLRKNQIQILRKQDKLFCHIANKLITIKSLKFLV